MSYSSMHKYLTDNKVWAALSIILLGWYLFPLFVHTFYVPTYDNLDSNVIWYKILAESGKIFAPNDAIIPNMMNGLPRSTYESEFSLLLWLYYFFTPKTAFIINEILIHLIAFFSMFFFLKRYVSPATDEYALVPVFIGSLYFALLPFWSGSGATIASIPLATYSLLNIKSRKSNIWDWIFLILIPFYSSFILFYIFYILMAGIYFLYDTVKSKHLNVHFLLALLLFGALYMLQNYRLLEALFIGSDFVTHRIEFNVFYNTTLWETYRLALINFLKGHVPHSQTLALYVLPIILIGMFLSLFRRKLTITESLIIWGLILLSFWIDIWKTVLMHSYTLPSIILFSIFLLFYNKKNLVLPVLILFIIFLSFAGAAQMYEGFKGITHYVPLLKSFNLRIHFILPFVYGILLVYSLKIFFKTLLLSSIFSILFILYQFNLSLNSSYFTIHQHDNYASFDSYYAPEIFKQIKKDMKEKHLHKGKFVSYGIEPAVSLYNGFYTVDGYSTNYPLSYKHKIRKVQEKECMNISPGNRKQFDTWGSKAYLLCTQTQPENYRYFQEHNITSVPLHASVKELCDLGTEYMFSAYQLVLNQEQPMYLLGLYENNNSTPLRIWLYRMDCDKVRHSFSKGEGARL